MWPSRSRLLTLIEQAMQDKAPAMHRRLKANERLAAELEARADLAIETYEMAIGAPDSPYLRAMADDRDHMKKVAAINRASKEA